MPSTLQADRLVALLRLHGVGDQFASGRDAWAAFKAFGREIFGAPNVGLLFQMGVYDFTGSPRFYFDPVCQFEINHPDGDHDHFEQLHCQLTCTPGGELSEIETSLWSFDYATADGFFAAVETLPAFQAAVRRSDYVISVSHEIV